MDIVSALGRTIPFAFASGINLYATIAVMGLSARFGLVDLPEQFRAFDHPAVIAGAMVLYAIEFFADKIPYLDSVWDVVHTFIRVPAGAVVAYAATNHMDAGVYTIATLLGGGLALSSHGTKAALRMGANLSPEPVSNWILSIVEDIIAFVGSLLAVFAPVLICIVLAIFILFFLWFAPKAFRAIRRIFNAVAGFFRGDNFKEVARKAG